MAHTFSNGWKRLANGFDVEFRHAIPVRLSDNGDPGRTPEPELLEEIARIGGLHVRLGRWLPGEHPNEHEARLYVENEELPEVLRRLAKSSAAMFVERYHKPIDREDVDWDRLEYVKDLRTALEDCGMQWKDIDRDAFLDDYLDTMHEESRRLAESKTSPRVEPE
jgi:hypothetical protein